MSKTICRAIDMRVRLGSPDAILETLENALNLAIVNSDERPLVRDIISGCKHAAQAHAIKLAYVHMDKQAENFSGSRLLNQKE